MKLLIIVDGLSKVFTKQAQSQQDIQSLFSSPEMLEYMKQQGILPNQAQPTIGGDTSNEFMQKYPLQRGYTAPYQQMPKNMLGRPSSSINWLPKGVPFSQLINQLTTPMLQRKLHSMGINAAPAYKFRQEGGVDNAVLGRHYGADLEERMKQSTKGFHNIIGSRIGKAFENPQMYPRSILEKYKNDPEGFKQYRQAKAEKYKNITKGTLPYLSPFLAGMFPDSPYGILQNRGPAAISQGYAMHNEGLAGQKTLRPIAAT
ncbi:hypothetical protein ACFLQL_02295 [Verrucomicrobiota bacterium]